MIKELRAQSSTSNYRLEAMVVVVERKEVARANDRKSSKKLKIGEVRVLYGQRDMIHCQSEVNRQHALKVSLTGHRVSVLSIRQTVFCSRKRGVKR